VIAACNWIVANKNTYNIRVANFSLHSATPSNFTRDPLDKAVEKLWFDGVFVVAASGNYGQNGLPTRVGYAPGNDPFVLTVGAIDIAGTLGVGDDTAAPWSAYGFTYDGFSKPELGAPGRYIVGPVPPLSTLAAEKAANIVAPGYLQASGTSFAAPVVAGAAAQLLARHPDWTPDQVKGALMVSARPAPNAAPRSLGVGELNAGKAATVSAPPNPNAALERFVGPDPNGGSIRVFNAIAWDDTARANVAWDSIAWDDVAWDSVAWDSVAWESISWDDVAWTDLSTSTLAWSDVAWIDVAWEDAAESDANAAGGYALTPEQAAAATADPDLAPAPDNLPPDVASTLSGGTTTATTSGTTTVSTSLP
jgi:serine protease AprX